MMPGSLEEEDVDLTMIVLESDEVDEEGFTTMVPDDEVEVDDDDDEVRRSLCRVEK